MADGFFYSAISRLGRGHLEKPSGDISDREVIRVLCDTLEDAADALQQQHENRQRGGLLQPGEIGAYISVEVPPGVDIADWLRDKVKAGKAAEELGPLQYTPVAMDRPLSVADLCAAGRDLPLYKRGDMRLVWVNAGDLQMHTFADLAAEVAE